MAIIIFNAKMYKILFGVSLRTAETWLREDKQKLNTERVTIGHVSKLYELDENVILSEINGKNRQ